MDFQIFNDGELEVINGLKELLPLINPAYSTVFIGVKKPENKDIAITVRGDGGAVREKLMRTETFGLNIFVEGMNASTRYQYISNLAASVQACLQNLPKLSNSIKNVTLQSGSLRVDAPVTEGEQRYLTFTAFRTAKTLTTNPIN